MLCTHDLHVANRCGSSPTRATLPCYGARARNILLTMQLNEVKDFKPCPTGCLGTLLV